MYNGAGVWLANSGGLPVVTLTTITTTMFNALVADIATSFSTVLCSDGQSTPTANIPLHGFKLTGVGNPTIAGDALIFGFATPIGSGGTGRTTITPNGTVLQSNGTSYVPGMNAAAAAIIFGL